MSISLNELISKGLIKRCDEEKCLKCEKRDTCKFLRCKEIMKKTTNDTSTLK